MLSWALCSYIGPQSTFSLSLLTNLAGMGFYVVISLFCPSVSQIMTTWPRATNTPAGSLHFSYPVVEKRSRTRPCTKELGRAGGPWQRRLEQAHAFEATI